MFFCLFESAEVNACFNLTCKQSFEVDSLHLPNWSMEQNLQIHTNYDQNARLYEENIGSLDLFDSLESQHGEQSGQFAITDIGSIIKTDMENSATLDRKVNHPALKQPLLGGISKDGLKNLDSFGRWMSKELGDVDEPQNQSSSGAYWEAVGSEVGNVNSNISSQVEFETYTMSPSLSQDQLYSIIDFSPNCAYAGTEIKVH